MKRNLDSDVLLEVALNRKPFVEQSGTLVSWCQLTPGSGVIAWHTVSNIYYMLRPVRGDASTRRFLNDLIVFAEVASGGTSSIRAALGMRVNDFEGAMQVAAGLSAGAQFFVTRNTNHFRGALIPAMTTADFSKRFLQAQ